MKALHLVSCRGWSSDAYWAARMAVELERRGHGVTLGCRAGSEARVIARARAEGANHLTTFAFASGISPAADVRDIRRLRGLLRGVDVVHVHRGKEHWLAAVAARLASTPPPIVRTRHIVLPVRPHAANRWLYRRATALVTTVTEAIRRQYLAAGVVSADRVVTLPGGADAERFHPGPGNPETRWRLGAEDATPLIGMVSGLRHMKGHLVVIDAARRLRAAGVKFRLAFVGQGPYAPRVRAAVGEAGLERLVHLEGFASDLPSVMRSIDVGVYAPLESDGMSRVVFEYLAAGTPLVASRVGVVPEILDGDHAVLVPAGDAGALAEALAALLADAARRARLAGAGRRLVEARYSGARVAEALETLYRALPRAPAAGLP